MIKEAIDKLQAMILASTTPVVIKDANVPFIPVTGKAAPELFFNDYTARPDRIRQSVTVLDPASYVEYYGKFADSNSRSFGDEVGLKVVGILDYHAPTAEEDGGTARWGSHKVTLTLRKSEEWNVWSAKNNVKMTQVEFAEHLEQYAVDIAKPSPASIMEIATDLQAHTEVSFGSGIRQQDGQVKFQYTEVTKTSAGGGQVSVPDRFTLSIPVFVGAERTQMEALLRFRSPGGKLQFWYTLVRPEAAVRAGFQAASAKISNDLNLTIIAGSAA